MPDKKHESYVKINPGQGKVELEWSFETVVKTESDGRLSCFIPAFNIYFTAKDKDAMNRKSEGLTMLYLDHFIAHTKGRYKDLSMQLHRLGFKSPNDTFTVSQFAHNRVIRAKFKATDTEIPMNFINAESISRTSRTELVA